MRQAAAMLDAINRPAQTRAVTVTIDNSGVSFLCSTDDTLLAGALRAGVGIAYECSSGGCGSCKFDLVEGEVELLREDTAGLKTREFERGKRLACLSRPRSDCRIRVREDVSAIPLIPPTRRVGSLIERFPLTHDLWEFRFRIDGDARFLPGQYALMELSQIGCVRAYSMANTPSGDGEWHFQIKRAPGGRATSRLFDGLTLGDEVMLDGPFSTAHLRHAAPRDVVCIAGGSGLAPMLSVVRGALEAPALSDRRIWLFYGGRSERDIVDAAHLAPLSDAGDRVRYVPVISEPDAHGGWSGPTGFVHEHIAAHLDQPFAAYEFYTAGPPAMVEAVRRMLILEQSTPVEQVHYDRFF